MEYTLLVQILGNFGFPIAVTIFLLVKLEKKLENLEGVIHSLSKTITALKEREK